MTSRHPYDLLREAAARIRWQQKLLCGLCRDDGLNMNDRDTFGLYLSLEDIYTGIAEALRQLESPAD